LSYLDVKSQIKYISEKEDGLIYRSHGTRHLLGSSSRGRRSPGLLDLNARSRGLEASLESNPNLLEVSGPSSTSGLPSLCFITPVVLPNPLGRVTT